MTIILENTWRPEPKPNGTWCLKLTNLGDVTLADFTLCVTSITRVLKTSEIANGTLVRRYANFHEFAPLEPLSLESGQSWKFEIEGASRIPLHHNDAAKSAWLSLGDGRFLPADVTPLLRADGVYKAVPERLPKGKLTSPISLTPWPNHVDVKTAAAPFALVPDSTASAEECVQMMAVGALQSRLFKASKPVFLLSSHEGTKQVCFAQDQELPKEGYLLEFGAQITLSSSSKLGQLRGLVSLAQMMHGANENNEFEFPIRGVIQDVPRYDWRGSHLDCCRQFWSFDHVSRFVDILAWYKFSVFHWHFTDDEAWRAEIKAYPELTSIGARRTMHNPNMLPQLGDPADGAAQFYTQGQMRAIVAQAEILGLEVMPEIETPGHASAAVAALSQLKDPDETPASYFPLQGFPNNAWNPGVEETFTVLKTILDELIDIFPSKYFHIGGDEVAQNAWMQSPKARALMDREGLADTFELQGWFAARMKNMLDKRGKVLVGWNELSLGGGVEPHNTVLMAWESSEVGIELAKAGYDVVMTPGQAYYLDMAQSDAWFENGAAWAGWSSPQVTYEYEAAHDFPDELQKHLRGVQSCIWCEHYTSSEWFNDLVFPRLLAVAEAGWTRKENKDFERFAAQAKLHPKL